MSTHAVIARGLEVAREGHLVLAASDFEVPAGAVTAVVGPNGAGKSTLLDAITGLVDIVSGQLTVLGRTPKQARPDVAYVLQSTKVNEAMPITVREVVAMGRYARLGPFGRFRDADRAAVDAAMERLAITDLARRHIGRLSGGQRQRVFVAQGLAQEGTLVLLDEPFTGLDLVSKGRILDVMAEEAAERGTVMYATHDLAEAYRADHVLVVSGRIVAQGPPDATLTPEILSAAYGLDILRFDDGGGALDDSGHRTTGRHVHFERR